jgi:hypothetical protein
MAEFHRVAATCLAFARNFSARDLLRIVAFHQLRARPLEFTFSFHFDADFTGLVEVRGVNRDETGVLLETEIEARSDGVWYRGFDEIVRRSEIHAPAPVQLTAAEALFKTDLDTKKEERYALTSRRSRFYG